MIASPEKPEPLKIVTLHDKGYGSVSSKKLELFRLYDKCDQLLSLVRLQPGNRHGDVKDVLRVWAITLLKGEVTVKVGRKKMLLEPYETAIIQPGPARSVTNNADSVAEFMIAEFLDK